MSATRSTPQIRSIALSWTIIGAAAGASLGADSGSMVQIGSLAIGGVIQFVVVGTLLGLLGSRASEVLLGGAVGFLAGIVSGGFALGELATFGLIVGAILGATIRPYLRLVLTVASWMPLGPFRRRISDLARADGGP